jgi:hypothetical protein
MRYLHLLNNLFADPPACLFPPSVNALLMVLPMYRLLNELPLRPSQLLNVFADSMMKLSIRLQQTCPLLMLQH